MKVLDVMNINSIRILSGTTMSEAADLAAVSNASGLFVVDGENNFMGVLSEGDMMIKTLPDIAEIMASPGGLEDSGYLFSEKGSNLARDLVDDHMIRKAVTLELDDPLIKAATTMALKKMRRLPVVKDGKLVGTISRGDICKVIFKS